RALGSCLFGYCPRVCRLLISTLACIDDDTWRALFEWLFHLAWSLDMYSKPVLPRAYIFVGHDELRSLCRLGNRPYALAPEYFRPIPTSSPGTGFEYLGV
ncbi:unnamed protein product, partial [Aphanomyces euteiches]